MISKHIACKVENDSYRRLAHYIADVSHSGEKCLFSWCEGAWNKDNYELAIMEVAATQNLNTRSQKEKTYHLLISFRMEDEQKLSEENFKEIEKRFAETLGFQEHQRHCGVHINTENIHMHIAYNMIHIDKLTRHEPFQDYKLRDNLCRELEKEYGLSIDNGIDPDDKSYKLSQNSATKESLTGEESFERFVMKNHKSIMQGIEEAQSWECVHKAFALYGLEVKQRANGLSIKNRKGRQAMKASKFDRTISYKKMTEKFGVFQQAKQSVKAKDWYKRKPLLLDYRSDLWKEFVKSSRDEEIVEIKAKWRKEKIKITGLAITRRKQKELLRKSSLKERLEINQLRQVHSVKSDNWLNFLQNKATAGNEEALEILRHKGNTKLSEKIDAGALGKFKESLQRHETKLKTDCKILASDKTYTAKKALLAVSRMQSITNEKFKYRITRTGAIVFEFEGGGKVVDVGGKVVGTEDIKHYIEKYKTISGVKMIGEFKENTKIPLL